MSPPRTRFVRADTPPQRASGWDPAAANRSEDPFVPPPQPRSESDTKLESPPAATTTTVTTAPPPLTGSSGQPEMAGMLKGEGTATGAASGILRPEATKEDKSVPYYLRTPSKPVRRTSEEYEAEYWEYAVKDPAKRMWLARRAIALGYAKYDPKSPYLVDESEFNATGGGSGIYRMWSEYGQIVQMNSAMNLLTPEQAIDQRYNFLGGDTAFDQLAKDAAAAVPNPIQTTTQTNTYTMSKAQADSVADKMAIALLGHMADEGAMKKARKAMNSLMAANPTVTTTTSDATNPDEVQVTTHTKAGVGPSDAADAYEMKLRRSSEGMAFNVGKLMETAMLQLDRGL